MQVKLNMTFYYCEGSLQIQTKTQKTSQISQKHNINIHSEISRAMLPIVDESFLHSDTKMNYKI